MLTGTFKINHGTAALPLNMNVDYAFLVIASSTTKTIRTGIRDLIVKRKKSMSYMFEKCKHF